MSKCGHCRYGSHDAECNPLNANLVKALARLCPESSQLALRNTEVPQSFLNAYFGAFRSVISRAIAITEIRT